MVSVFHVIREFFQFVFSIFIDNAGVFISSLLGAFFGAAAAYWSQRVEERRKKQNDEVGAIVRAQLALISQFNVVSNLSEQHLKQFREDPQRAMKMIAFDMTGSHLRVAYDSISFLLATKNPNLVLHIEVAEHSYISAMEALSLRNKAYEKMHENSKLERFDPKTGQCAVKIEDPRSVKLVCDWTDALFVSVDKACERLPVQIVELYKVGKLLYPKREFLKVETAGTGK